MTGEIIQIPAENPSSKSESSPGPIRWVGVAQVLAAVSGIILMLRVFASNSNISLMSTVFLLLLIVFNATAGITAFRGQVKWYRLTLVNQLLQVVGFGLYILHFNYSGLIVLQLQFMWGFETGYMFWSRIGPGYRFNLSPELLSTHYILIDLTAVVFAWICIRAMYRANK
jgi:hypothetical protein